MVKKIEDPIVALNSIAELKARSKEVTVENRIITIKTLGARDETDSFVECMKLWGQAMIYKHKLETMYRAITHIDGISLEKVDFTEKKMIIDTWKQEIIDQLYNEYAILLGIAEEFFEKIKFTAETNVIGAKDEMNENKDDKNE